jgi:hypothetical protein
MPAIPAMSGWSSGIEPQHPEDEVGREEGGVPVAVGGLDAGHPRHEGVVVGDRAPAHERRDDRDLEQLRQLDEQLARVRVDHAPAGDDQRSFGLGEHRERPLGLGPGGPRLVDREGGVGLRVEVDLGELHVEGEVDQHGPGSPGAHQVERLREGTRHLTGLAHRHRHLAQRRHDRGDGDRLEVLLVEPCDRCLTRDAEDRDRVGGGGVEAGDHVGAGRT